MSPTTRSEIHDRCRRMAEEIEDAKTKAEAFEAWCYENDLGDWHDCDETPEAVALDEPYRLQQLSDALDQIDINYRDIWESDIEDAIEEAWRLHIKASGLTFTDDPDNACTWMDGALECYERGRRPLHESEWQPLGEVVIVQCTGGPHIEIVVTGTTARIDGFWGGDKASVHVDRDKVLACFPEVGEFVR